MMNDTEIKTLAAKIRDAETWEEDDVRALCEAADMLEAYESADGDTVESVIFSAAEELGVKVI